MADMMEKIALGGLSLRGEIDMQITDPLTGRPYYQFKDHNLILDGLYEYLKMLCIAALCSYDGHYAYRPMTCLGMESKAGYPVSDYSGFCTGQSDSASAGNGTNGPSTSTNYVALKCPVERIVLTDNEEAEDVGRREIAGNVVAEADFRTLAPSGGIRGTFGYSKSEESLRKVYRRWDWTSTNGNGKLARIHLCANYSFIPFFDRTKSFSTLSVPSFRGTCIGGSFDKVVYLVSRTNAEVVFDVHQFDPNTYTFRSKTFSADLSGKKTYPNSRYFCVVAEKEGSDKIRLIAHSCSAYDTVQIYTIDFSADLILCEEYKQTGSGQSLYSSSGNYSDRNICFAYADDDGETVFMANAYCVYKTKPDNTAVYIRKGSASTAVQFAAESWMTEFDGRYIRFLEDYSELRISVSDTTDGTSVRPPNAKTAKGMWKNFSGLKKAMKIGGLYYLIKIYQSDAIPFMQVDVTPSIEKGILTMTERLLPEPVVKDGMPMYVGYTLNFE